MAETTTPDISWGEAIGGGAAGGTAATAKPKTDVPDISWKGDQAKSYAVTGNTLRVTLEAESWDAPGTILRLDCGSFEIDAVDFSDPPPTVQIKATAVPLTKTIRSQAKSKAWERVKLSELAGQIATDAGMKLMYEADADPLLDRVDQRQTSDLAFLRKLCIDEGMALKVTDDKIVIFQEAKYEAKDAVMTFYRGDERIIGVSFSQDTSQTAKSATCQYKDPISGKLVKETFEPDEAPATERELIMNDRPHNLSGDAIREAADA